MECYQTKMTCKLTINCLMLFTHGFWNSSLCRCTRWDNWLLLSVLQEITKQLWGKKIHMKLCFSERLIEKTQVCTGFDAGKCDILLFISILSIWKLSNMNISVVVLSSHTHQHQKKQELVQLLLTYNSLQYLLFFVILIISFCQNHQWKKTPPSLILTHTER